MLNGLSFVLVFRNGKFAGWLLDRGKSDGNPAVTVFQLDVILFCFSPCIQGIIAFVFKDNYDAFLVSYHLVLNKPHDSLGSMAININYLFQVTDVSNHHCFCTAESDFVQSLTTSAPAVPKCSFISKMNIGLGCG